MGVSLHPETKKSRPLKTLSGRVRLTAFYAPKGLTTLLPSHRLLYRIVEIRLRYQEMQFLGALRNLPQ